MPGLYTFRTWDDYFIPGTSVLRNKFIAPGKPFGEPDAATLKRLEEAMTAQRLGELTAAPIQGRFDYAHMKAIHGYIFQDVYEWAGQARVAPTHGPMTKMGPDVVSYAVGDPSAPWRSYSYYPAGPAMESAAEAQYAKLAGKNLLQGLDHETFVRELGEIWGELNVIHVFREGNTRSQFAFFTQLAAQAGWKIEPTRFLPSSRAREEFVAARFYSQATGDNSRLVDVLRKEVVPLHAPPAQTLAAQRAATRKYLGEEISRRIAERGSKPTELGPTRPRRGGLLR